MGCGRSESEQTDVTGSPELTDGQATYGGEQVSGLFQGRVV